MHDPPRAPIAMLLALVVVAAGCVPTPANRPSATPGMPSASVAPSAPTATPAPTGPTPSPSFVRPIPTPLPTFTTHVVASGDSLISLARTYSTTPFSIAIWNRDTYPSLDPESAGYDPNRIEVGWTLVIQPNVTIDEVDVPPRTPTPAPSSSDGATPS